ncbi:MAG TPA: GNAT family N-acetyltransferase [Dehalococcoidia bacterium]|jgi:GNAT superfamily N-acetyltransferase
MTSWIVSEDVLAQEPLIRDARRDDIARIVDLYRSDELTRKHHADADAPVEAGYYASFDAIERDPRNRLLVAELGFIVVGSFQLTFVPDMSPSGNDVAIIENVIVDAALRGHNIGSVMMRWAIEEATRSNCHRVTLTSSKQRKDAHRFYERLGFEPTHEGMKIVLA